MSTTTALLPGGRPLPAIIEEIKTKFTDLKKVATEYAITDETTQKFVIESGSLTAKLLKALEAERKKLTAPLNEELDGINAYFKQFSDPLTQIKKALGDKETAYRSELRRRAEEETRRMQAILDEQRKKELEAAAAKGIQASTVALEAVQEVVVNTTVADTGSSTGRKRWTFKVTDFSKVQDENKLINGPAINAQIRDGKRGTEIPGIEIYQEESTVFK